MQNPFAPGSSGKSRPASKTDERRRAERHVFSAVADVTEPLSNAGVSVRISDLGLNGCYADSLTVFPVGTTVKLSMRHSGRHFETLAKVVYGKTGMGMGLTFENLSAEMQSILRELLPGAGENPAETLESSLIEQTPEPAVRPGKEKRVLGRLIELMMYKGQLTEVEGRELLKQLQQER